MATKLNSFILSDDVIKQMKTLLDKSRVRNLEEGFSICREENKNILKFGNSCEGNECRIRRPFQRCQGTDLYEGFYHTHPDEKARPSTADSYGMYIDGLGCIGSPKYNDINCYVRKDPEIDPRVLDDIEFEHMWIRFHGKEIDDIRYEQKLQFIADKHFKRIGIL